MALVLMIAAGVLLAFLLLPLLGPIVMIAICIAVFALLGYGIMMSIGAGIAAVDIAKEAAAKAQNAKQLSFKINSLSEISIGEQKIYILTDEYA